MYIVSNKPAPRPAIRPVQGLGFFDMLFDAGSGLMSAMPSMSSILDMGASAGMNLGTKFLDAKLIPQAKPSGGGSDSAALIQANADLANQATATAAANANAVRLAAAQAEAARVASAAQAAQAARDAKTSSDAQAALEKQRYELQLQMAAAKDQGNAAQFAQLQAALTKLPPPAGMSTGTILAIAGGGVAVLGLVMFLALRKS